MSQPPLPTAAADRFVERHLLLRRAGSAGHVEARYSTRPEGSPDDLVVVVPLEPRRDRSAGQQTYLNAMVLGKPVVVTDSLGVREYVDDRRTGLIVPAADPGALRAALDWLLDPDNAAEAEAIGERARAAALERFGPERYVSSLLSVVDAALERRAAAGK